MSGDEFVSVYLAGAPRGQSRARSAGKGGHFVSVPKTVRRKGGRYAPNPVWYYREAVRRECRRALLEGAQPFTGAVEVRLQLWFPCGRYTDRIGQPHTPKPDGDNVLKLWQDAAELMGLLPEGDARVARNLTEKLWARDGGALFMIRPFQATPGPWPVDDDESLE